MARTGAPERLDLVLVVAEANRGWILDRICREVLARFQGQGAIHYGEERLPPAAAYFYSHPMLFQTRYWRERSVRTARNVVFFTHPWSTDPSAWHSDFALRRADHVISMSSTHLDVLQSRRIDPRRSHVIIPGVDLEAFRPHRRAGRGAVGLSAAYYPRKNPRVLVEVVQRLSHRPFRLLGRGWRAAPEFDVLSSAPNFTYLEVPYVEYPAHYAAMDVFLSASLLEGGPMPLLEAMAANVVPVVSQTGFAPDVVRHGENGFLFDTGSPADRIAELVEGAYSVETDVRSTIDHLTWERFADEVLALL